MSSQNSKSQFIKFGYLDKKPENSIWMRVATMLDLIPFFVVITRNAQQSHTIIWQTHPSRQSSKQQCKNDQPEQRKQQKILVAVEHFPALYKKHQLQFLSFTIESSKSHIKDCCRWLCSCILVAAKPNSWLSCNRSIVLLYPFIIPMFN